MGRLNPSRETKLSGANGNKQGNINFPRSADHEQDWQLYPTDSYSAICNGHTYKHTASLDFAAIYTTRT